MKIPPHLPPKSCSIPLYRRLMLSSSLLILTFVALASGIVGGIVADVYITQDVWTNIGTQPQQPTLTKQSVRSVDPFFAREQLRRTVALVPKDVYEETGVVPLEGVSYGVLLTDTGWFVAPQPSASFRPEAWVAVLSTGDVYSIATVVPDTLHGLVYGSLDGEGFRVVSFPTIDVLHPGTAIWMMGTYGFSHGTMADATRTTDDDRVYLAGAEAYRFSLASNPIAFGTVIWDEEGAFVGFVDTDGTIIPWFVVESMYTRVFTGQPLESFVLPIEGYAVRLSEQQHAQANGATYGFFVEDVMSEVGAVLLPGDVVTHIAGTPVVPWFIQGVVALQSTETVSVTLLRNGERVDVSVAKITVE